MFSKFKDFSMDISPQDIVYIAVLSKKKYKQFEYKFIIEVWHWMIIEKIENA